MKEQDANFKSLDGKQLISVVGSVIYGMMVRSITEHVLCFEMKK